MALSVIRAFVATDLKNHATVSSKAGKLDDSEKRWTNQSNTPQSLVNLQAVHWKPKGKKLEASLRILHSMTNIDDEPREEPFDEHSGSRVSMTGRGRSLSVASTQPSVETVVSKAKQAATVLWTLLHAKVS